MTRILIKLSTHCILTVALLSTSNVFAGEYLPDVLEKPNYLKSWNSLISNVENVDYWLANYSKTKNAVSTPSKLVTLSDGTYQINFLCKPHDCANNKFFVLFSPNGSKAWGLLLKITYDKNETEITSQTTSYFGNPDEEKEHALLAKSIK